MKASVRSSVPYQRNAFGGDIVLNVRVLTCLGGPRMF